MASNKKKGAKSKSKTAPIKWLPSEIKGLLILGCALVFLTSLISISWGHLQNNWIGIAGYTLGWILQALFGLSSYGLVVFFGWIGWRLLFSKPLNHLIVKTLYLLLGITSLSMLLTVFEVHYPLANKTLSYWIYPSLAEKKINFHMGGAPFYFFYHDLPFFNLNRVLSSIGVTLVFSCTLLASVIYLAKITPQQIFNFVKALWPQPEPTLKKQPVQQPPVEPFKGHEEPVKEESDFMRYVKLRIPEGSLSSSNMETRDLTQPSHDMLAIQPEQQPTIRPSISRKGSQDAAVAAQQAPKPSIKKVSTTLLPQQSSQEGNYSNFSLPPTSLLTSAKKVDQTSLKQNLKKQAEVLEETLFSFGIEAKVGQINCGPTITSFEVHPAIGVKVQKIKTLENDIALNMEAKSIRIIAPIPGKAAVGIEVPNPQPQEVSFKEMLQGYQQGSSKLRIPILLGKAVNGDFVMSDLAKMPHCIIAGATGSGKSVCINTIVMSIVMNAKPDEIKLIMVDPKKVELTPYTKLPHMLAPVITEPHGACAALKWLVKEMENRYDILKLIGVRNIDSFNHRTINKEFEESLDRPIPASLPYIVGIIDELADLMMVASNDIETPIARIAQMARAVGIHLILATQRPSREVITGLIKANFPTRISFKVASRVNSQIVLDEIGAESLLGNGDMLFLPPGTSNLVRAQGAFIRDEDINAVVKFICDQASPNYVIASFDQMITSDDSDSDAEEEPTDSLYEEAKNVILSTGNASTTFLQRKLKVGYARAASIIDQLEQRGIVGPAEGSKPRKILAATRRLEDEESSPEEALELEAEELS